jgi:hypothetical protein
VEPRKEEEEEEEEEEVTNLVPTIILLFVTCLFTLSSNGKNGTNEHQQFVPLHFVAYKNVLSRSISHYRESEDIFACFLLNIYHIEKLFSS